MTSDFEESIRDITGLVWEALLGLPVQETPFRLLPIGPADTLTGMVEISGDWRGRVCVACARSLAQRVAAVMFDLDPAAAGERDLADALGEVTNMTGGNLKTVLGDGHSLSLPSVDAGTVFTPDVPDGRLVSQVAFECDGEPFVVSVFQNAVH